MRGSSIVNHLSMKSDKLLPLGLLPFSSFHSVTPDGRTTIISPVESLNWSPGNVVCPVSRSVPDWVLEAIRISDDINELVPSFSFPDAHIIFRFDIITHIQQ